MTMLAFQTQVQDLLPDVEARMRSQTAGYHPILKDALDQLLDSGGKRVRPTVVLLVSSMLGVARDLSISLAAAVELLHTATLVHDDLIDDAKLRRGKPTLNATLSTSATILTGDFLFSQAAWLGAQVEITGSNAHVRQHAFHDCQWRDHPDLRAQCPYRPGDLSTAHLCQNGVNVRAIGKSASLSWGG